VFALVQYRGELGDGEGALRDVEEAPTRFWRWGGRRRLVARRESLEERK